MNKELWYHVNTALDNLIDNVKDDIYKRRLMEMREELINLEFTEEFYDNKKEKII